MKKFLASMFFILRLLVIGIGILLLFQFGQSLVHNDKFEPAMLIGIIGCFIVSKVFNVLSKILYAESEIDRGFRNSAGSSTCSDATFPTWQNDLALQSAQAADMSSQAADMAMQAAENARLANTGIEFGGWNPAPELNPGLQSSIDQSNNSFDSFSSFDNFNTFGSF